MKKTILMTSTIGLVLAMSVACCQAADWYVRPSGGTGAGTSWTAAWNGLSSINWASVSCGDTIWVSGGTYNQDLIPKKKCTISSQLYIQRARTDAAECTGAAGWSNSFDSKVHQTRAGVYISGDYDYITVSGRTVASGGSHGWWIDFKGATSGPGIEFYNGADGDYNTFEYMDIEGPGSITYTADGRGIDATPFSGADGNTFSHLKIWDWESGIYNVGIDGSTFEYIEMFNMMANNWQSYHPNGIYLSGSSNGIIRYSKFYKAANGVGEGIFFEQAGGCDNWKIYGNIFYNLDQTGLKAIEITSTVTNLKIYNNVFDNILTGGIFVNQGACGSGSESKNNLAYATSVGSCGATSNNLVASSASVFANRAGHDYHITSSTGSGLPRNAGTALSNEYSTDMDGNSRGADGAWDIGAYEYSIGQAQKCSDGTNYGACSSAKPKYCQNGALINNCQACGCTTGQTCQGDGTCQAQQQTCSQQGGTCCATGQTCTGSAKTASDCNNCCAGTCQTSCIPGDLNCDKKVDIFDLVLVAQNYAKTSGFDVKADANKDGKIDIFDLVIVAQNYGRTG